MEDVREYRTADDDDLDWTIPDDERQTNTAPRDEVPFHIPRD
jgi:hypothetical protein